MSWAKSPLQKELYVKVCCFIILLILSFLCIYLGTKSVNFSVKPMPMPKATLKQLKPQIIRNSHKNLSQNDTKILEHIRKYRLTEPSKRSYNLTPNDNHINSVWTDPVSKFVLQLLNYKLGGFFIECGANDGEFLSNTLMMELKYGWTGLLVEADPVPLAVLRQRNRKAWIADVCLSTLPHPHKVEMRRNKRWNGLSFVPKYFSGRSSEEYSIKFSAQCYPIFSILSSLEVKVVDYFRLDIEGAELAVLKTFPFDDSIIIKVISAEVNLGRGTELKAFLATKGYTVAKYIEGPYVHDLVFVHSSVKHIT